MTGTKSPTSKSKSGGRRTDAADDQPAVGAGHSPPAHDEQPGEQDWDPVRQWLDRGGSRAASTPSGNSALDTIPNVVNNVPSAGAVLPGSERGSVSPTGGEEEEEKPAAGQPGFVAHEEKRRRGRPKKERPSIVSLWKEVEQLATITTEQQTRIAQRFQGVLDKLAGQAGQSQKENEDLAATITDVADRGGLDLVYDGHVVSVFRRHKRTFEVRVTIGGEEQSFWSAEFPRLTVRARSPAEGVDIGSYVAQARNGQLAGNAVGRE